MYITHLALLLNTIVVLSSVLTYSGAFEITESSIYVNDTEISGKQLIFENYNDNPGETVIFKCVTSDWYEFCSWKHDNQVCKFEWKRSYGEVRKQSCDINLNERIKFFGNYNEHECSIELSNLTLSDAGEWTCDLESYVWGPISGTKDTAVFNLSIDSGLDNETTLIDSSVELPEEVEGRKQLKVIISELILR